MFVVHCLLVSDVAVVVCARLSMVLYVEVCCKCGGRCCCVLCVVVVVCCVLCFVVVVGCCLLLMYNGALHGVGCCVLFDSGWLMVMVRCVLLFLVCCWCGVLSDVCYVLLSVGDACCYNYVHVVACWFACCVLRIVVAACCLVVALCALFLCWLVCCYKCCLSLLWPCGCWLLVWLVFVAVWFVFCWSWLLFVVMVVRWCCWVLLVFEALCDVVVCRMVADVGFHCFFL